MSVSCRVAVLCGASLFVLSMPAHAQETAPGAETDAQTAEEGTGVAATNEIIVTARRRNETLQDVPQTINAVSRDTIERLRINNAADIATVTPGVSIEGASSGSGGFGSSSSIRGVPTFLNSNATPIVQFYLNDAPTGRGPEATQILYDIGQVEVLKGPQGTLRGRSAPAGAITITTRRPDMSEIGGFVNMSGTSRGNINAQAGVSLPIIADVLAVRLAGAVDHNSGNGVTSVNNRLDPFVRTETGRATIRFEPSSNFSATLMYQYITRNSRSFSQVAGPGNGANGPAIRPRDRLAITDGFFANNGRTHFVVGQFEWNIAGQKLSYVGSYRNGKSDGQSPQDQANLLPGIEYYQTTSTPTNEMSHELRLSSEDRLFGFLDYTVGGFYDRERSTPTVSQTAAFLAGAFGRPGTAPRRIQPVSRYALGSFIDINPEAEELSLFGNVTAHIGDRTELSGGGRLIRFKRDEQFSIATGSAFNAITNPLIPSPAFCGFLPGVPAGTVASPVYPGLPAVCDIPIAPRTIQDLTNKTKDTPFVYNISLSHKITPDILLYGNVGTAFRTAGPTIGITSVLTCCAAPGPSLGSIQDLIFHQPERSTTYEAGFKATFLDRRARLNVSYFHQKFRNFYFLTQPTRYLSVPDPTNPAGGSVASAEFTADSRAKVDGVDVEGSFNITERWSLNVGYTYSKARLANALIPCNDGNFDGVVDTIVPTVQNFINARTLLARCNSSESVARTPNWNLTVQSEYSMPITSSFDGFIRGNFNYYPSNRNASQGRVIDNYSLLNLFVGLRETDSAWEVTVFANNLLNTSTLR